MCDDGLCFAIILLGQLSHLIAWKFTFFSSSMVCCKRYEIHVYSRGQNQGVSFSFNSLQSFRMM